MRFRAAHRANAFVKLSKEYSELEPAARAAMGLKKAYGERRDVEDMLAAGGEMADMAAAEKPELDSRIAQMEHDIRILLLPKDAADDKQRDPRGSRRHRR